MLQQVLNEIETAREPLSVAAMARKLAIDESALEGMIGFWVRKGRIKPGQVADQSCSSGSCGSCAGATGCPFAGTAPRTFFVVPADE